MDVKINEISSSEHEVEVTLTYDEIKNDIEAEVRKQAKSIQIPGFRKGKVPMQMIKKMYGDSLEYEASEKVSNKKFWEIAKEKEINPLGQPSLTDIKFNPNENLYFKVKYEVVPSIDVKNYTDQEIKIPEFKMKPEDVEHEINHIKKENRIVEQAEAVGDDRNYILKAEFQRLNENDEPFEGSQPEVLDIDLTNEQVHADIVENSKGKKPGEEFIYTFEDKQKKKNDDGSEEEVTENYKFRVKILEIKKISHPELTEEFVKKVTKNKASSEEELRKQIEGDIQAYFDQRTNDLIKDRIVKMLVDNNQFAAPSYMVKGILDDMIKREEEQYKQYGYKSYDKNEAANRLKTSAEMQVKWFLLKKELQKKENIQVNDEDIESLAKADAEKTGIDIEKLKAYYRSSNHAERIIDEKIFNFLREKNKIVKLDPKEFSKNDSKDTNE